MNERTGNRIVLLLSVGALVVAASCSPPGVVLRAPSPDQSHVALVRSHWALDPPKQSLWLAGSDERAAVRLRVLGEDSEWCDQIVWKPDGSEVGFVLNGHRLLLYNAETEGLVADLDLIAGKLVEGGQVARNVHFSPEGATVEFEICPAERDSPCLETRTVAL